MLSLLFRLIAKLPLAWLHAAGAILGRVVLRVAPRYRSHLEENLKQAGLSDPALVRRAAEEAGKSVLELPYVWFASPEKVLAKIGTAHWPIVEEARAAKKPAAPAAGGKDTGKGIIFLTPHLGCFEISAQYVAAYPPPDGVPITVLYRPPRKAWIVPVMEEGRARKNLIPAPANLQGVRQMLRALKRSEAIGMLPDQVPSVGEGVWAPFFGKPAFTMTLPAKLREMTGATIILAYGERLAHGRGWVVHFFRFDDEPGGTLEERTSKINAAIEKVVLECPAQYFWGYDRYKKPKGAPPADRANE